ncbi:MAG: arginine N-succinyltransferase [Proteobacteria bacterium]|nr:arginine N-succinyltransferase [Pseudomonadota bacterium]
MLVVRPAGPADLDDLYELAVRSGRGFTSLPEHEPTLRERLRISELSFSGELPPQDCWYTLMLEDETEGEILGVSGVHAAVGLKRPFFSFRVVTLAQSSSIIGLRFDHRALVLVNECTGWTEVGSLFLKPERRKGGAGRLLAQSRYMLIGAEPDRFAEMVLAELRGWFDKDDHAPFWEHVSSKFFRLPFDEADRMSASTDGQFILDLAPRHPIYLELLPAAACEAVGRVHEDGAAAQAMLVSEGFRYAGMVDIFDAGPTVSCPKEDIRTVRDALHRTVRVGEPDEGRTALLSTDCVKGFRAVRARAELVDEQAVIAAETADALKLKPGDRVRVKS